MSESLRGRHVMVVGGSAGIGLATARLAEAAGARVTIAARDAVRLEQARQQLGDAMVRTVDMRDEASVAALFAGARVDHVVVTASEAAGGEFARMPVAEARAFFDSKFWGPYQVARAAAGVLPADGSITLFSGAAAEVASPGFAVGSTINGAIEVLVRTLAVELAPLRVNAVSPGIIDTPVWASLPGIDGAQVFAETAARVPARRVGRAEEVAAAVLLILGNGYITGTTLRVDGGYALS